MTAHNNTDGVASTSTSSAGGDASIGAQLGYLNYTVQVPARVLRQHVWIDDVDCKAKAFTVRTEMQVLPVHNDIIELRFNLGLYSRLPNEENGPSGAQIKINGYPAAYTRSARRLKLSDNPMKRNLKHLKSALARYYSGGDPDQVILTIPDECRALVAQQRVLQVELTTRLYKPKHSILFHCDYAADDTLRPGAHIFTYRSNAFSSTHEWLPCMDAPDQLALWRLEFVVPAHMTAVASGDLIQTTHNERAANFVYQVSVPAAPINIGFVVAELESHIQSELPDVTNYALPGLLTSLEHTVLSLPRIFSCLQETLTSRFPFSTYKQVFVDNVPEEMISFAGLSIFSVNLLYHKKILEAVQTTRQLLTYAVSAQFFGCFIHAADLSTLWLVRSLARCITGLYVEKVFGRTEYIHQTRRLLQFICEYEVTNGPIVLQPSVEHGSVRSDLHFNSTCPYTCSPVYADIMYKKGQFVLRTLQTKLGQDTFLKVLNRVLAVASELLHITNRPIGWSHMLLTTESFFNTVTTITGRELPTFLDLFVYSGGHTHFEINCSPNRKRSTLELQIRQIHGKGRRSYVGPLKIYIQELDGYYPHTLQIDADISQHDLQCHSKGRKQKRKKVVISTGQEVEIEMGNLEQESPILWIRVDPGMQLLRSVALEQPSHQWELMLRHERCPIAQCDAIDNLRQSASQESHKALYDTVQTETFFYKVRTRAAFALTDVGNRIPDGMLLAPIPMLSYFQRLHCSNSEPKVPKQLNFVVTSSNLQAYYIQQTLPQAIARVRKNGRCPDNVTQFLINLLRCNDNSANRYADDHYRAALIQALTSTLTPFDEHGIIGKVAPRPDDIPEIVQEVIALIIKALNMDQLKPSYGRAVSIAAIKSLWMMQHYGYFPYDPEIFFCYATPKDVFSQVRLTALEILCSIIHRTHNVGLTDATIRIFQIMLQDPNPHIRYTLANMLARKGPFIYSSNVTNSLAYALNTTRFAEFMWSLVTDVTMESKLRAYIVDAFYAMYAMETPLMLMPVEERHRLEREEREAAEISASQKRL